MEGPYGPVSLPYTGSYRKTSGFGKRTAPVAGASTDHGGVDIAMPVGTPIYAPAGCVVTETGFTKSNGNYLVCDKPDFGITFKFLHLNDIYAQKGTTVGKGWLLAHSGNTGTVKGTGHLHFVIEKDGVPIDPDTFYGGQY